MMAQCKKFSRNYRSIALCTSGVAGRTYSSTLHKYQKFIGLQPTKRTLPIRSLLHSSSHEQPKAQSAAQFQQFEKVLIANRGEIACRVIRTCRKMGIRTVAVFSIADGPNSLHASMADESYLVGSGPEAKKSYLLSDEILSIAARSGANAIHPGYGFLSENQAFATACAAHPDNIIFIGPPPFAIGAMGSKSESKRIMMDAGVPCTPGYHGSEQNPDFLLQQARENVGFPCLIKATAGGGGKGMRLVDNPKHFLDALHACKRESMSAFGDDAVILERYLTNPRHIEVQICADMHGNAVHLFERDCSVQRRHQKVLEEAPAPGLCAEARRRIGDVAVRAANAVGYVGAGTVEFLMERDSEGQNKFYFCEMNTRLQVEHPVTEMITGLDLVEWQLRVAAGQVLPIVNRDGITMKGHALEARVYAENPMTNFLPATGKLVHLRPPSGEGLRVDTGVRQGDDVNVYYDPMISKLIAFGHDRSAAIDLMLRSLRNYQVVGVPTNIRFLEKCVSHPSFRAGGFGTEFLTDAAADAKLIDEPKPSLTGQALCVLALHLVREGRTGIQNVKDARRHEGPWSTMSASWRAGRKLEQHLQFSLSASNPADSAMVFSQFNADNSFTIQIEGQVFHVDGTLDQKGRLVAKINERRISLTAIFHEHVSGDLSVFLWADTGEYVGNEEEFYCSMTLLGPQIAATSSSGVSGRIQAPMPGKVIRFCVEIGDSVEVGDGIIVLEAMKMEHVITSPRAGLVSSLECSIGDIVDGGCVLGLVTGEIENEGGQV